MRWSCTFLACSNGKTTKKPVLQRVRSALAAVRRVSTPGLVLACAWLNAFAQGPGCPAQPGVPPPAVGADVPVTYFGLAPSTVQRELVGPLQLLTAGLLDQRAATITLPLYRGRVRQGGQTVWYILTDTTDRGNAEALGLNFAPKLFYSAVSARSVRTATLQRDNTLEFEAGTVDFTPDHVVTPAPGPNPFPPMVAAPGSVGDANYSPLVRITNAGGHIYNAPIVAVGDNVGAFMAGGRPDYRLVHDKVVSISINPQNPFASTVTLALTTGFSFAKPVLYLSTDASMETVAALEAATLAPGLQDIEVGNDDSAFSAVERIFITINGPRGCDNPQRQGIDSALLDGRSPLNVLGGIPTVATDYSPLWDANVGAWTDEAIQKAWRSRVIDEFQILALVEAGAITGPGGAKYGSAGFVINCPIVFRFL
ncbi:MAG: hypothetical protein IT158_07440 [Bryobacterales bacterium]|nr:hypothetical protein [Bryobacterales bacterium]